MALRSPRNERGQSAVFVVLLMTTLVGMLALVIDVGSWRETRGNMINAADAGALAGASYLPLQPDKAIEIADATARANGATSDTPVVLSTNAANDTIRVSVTKAGLPLFSRVLGFASFPINASSTAVVKSYTSYTGAPLFPVAIDVNNEPPPNAVFDLKSDHPDGGNTGAVFLPGQDEGCTPPGPGTPGWTNELSGEDVPCTVTAGDELGTKTGCMDGPTETALDTRLAGDTDTFDDVIALDPNGGLSQILKPDSPRLAVVPLVDGFDSGSDTVTVVGFAFIFIEGSGGCDISARMIQSATTLQGAQTGPGTPLSGVRQIQLVA